MGTTPLEYHSHGQQRSGTVARMECGNGAEGEYFFVLKMRISLTSVYPDEDARGGRNI